MFSPHSFHLPPGRGVPIAALCGLLLLWDLLGVAELPGTSVKTWVDDVLYI